MSSDRPGAAPRLRRHVRGHGTVRLSRQDHYLGPWPDPTSPAPPAVQAKYHELVARWVAGGRKPLARAGEKDRPVLVNDLVARFVEHLRADYPAGSREPDQYELALRPLAALFGLEPGATLSAKVVEKVRDEMIRRDWSRKHVNRSVNRTKRLVRWAVRGELIPAACWQSVSAVEPLRAGQRGVKESPRRRPATLADVVAVCEHLTAPLAAMVMLCWLTGMRPGEVRRLTAGELDRSDAGVWVYRPSRHKTAHADQKRSVAIGPKGIEVLRPWLARAGGGPVFSPRSLVDEHLAAVRKRATGDVLTEAEAWACSWFGRVPGRMLARAGETYTDNGFEASVRTAAEKAGRKWFSCYCTRHGFRMAVGRAANDEAARAALGQRHISSTVHYGELDEDLAKETMRKLG